MQYLGAGGIPLAFQTQTWGDRARTEPREARSETPIRRVFCGLIDRNIVINHDYMYLKFKLCKKVSTFDKFDYVDSKSAKISKSIHATLSAFVCRLRKMRSGIERLILWWTVTYMLIFASMSMVFLPVSDSRPYSVLVIGNVVDLLWWSQSPAESGM